MGKVKKLFHASTARTGGAGASAIRDTSVMGMKVDDDAATRAMLHPLVLTEMEGTQRTGREHGSDQHINTHIGGSASASSGALRSVLRKALWLIGSEAFFAPIATLRQGSFVGSHPVARWMSPAPRRSAALRTLCMESTSDFKNGMTIDIDGNPCKILEFLHVKPGKGSAFVRTKIRNLISGNSLEKTFRAGESVSLAQVDKLELQFTYIEGDTFFFMDTNTFEEVTIDAKIIGDKAGFMVEGMNLEALFFKGRAIDVSIPKQMVYEVVETDPGAKGNTAQGGSKPAKLESGATINVPLFITTGEKIRVDTESKKYMERAKE